jgi:hypothetical protein
MRWILFEAAFLELLGVLAARVIIELETSTAGLGAVFQLTADRPVIDPVIVQTVDISVVQALLVWINPMRAAALTHRLDVQPPVAVAGNIVTGGD